MAHPSPYAGIVLAAGEGQRFGGPKAPFVVNGERLVDHSVRIVREAGLDPVIVVLGAWVGDVPDCETVVNPDYRAGIGSSLISAITYAQTTYPHLEGVIITLVDLPDLLPSTVKLVCDEPAPLVQARCNGQPGHPVKIDAIYFDELLESVLGDSGAKEFLTAHNVAYIDVDDQGSVADLDFQPR